MAKEIVYEELKAFIDEGKKKEELAEIYELPMSQVTKLLQQAGLKIRKFHAPKFILVGGPAEEPAVEATRPVDSDVPVEEVNTPVPAQEEAHPVEAEPEFFDNGRNASTEGGW